MVWSPFLTEHSVSDSDEPDDCSVTSEEDETISNISENETGVETSGNETTTSDSLPNNIFDMQFNQLQNLVDSIQDEREYDEPPNSPDEGSVTDHPLMPNNELEVAQDDVLQADQDDENEAHGGIDEEFDQHKPKKGDRIDFLCPKQSIWLQATLTSDGMKRYGGHNHNYRLDNGDLGGVDLLPGTAWTHPLQVLQADDQLDAVDDQLDAVDEEPGPVDPHNNAFEDGPVHNPLQMAFPEVRNLNDVLPLSSTPMPTTSTANASRSRLYAHRPLLPMEIDESPLHRPSGSRIQQAMVRRADQVRKLLSRSSSDSSAS